MYASAHPFLFVLFDSLYNLQVWSLTNFVDPAPIELFLSASPSVSKVSSLAMGSVYSVGREYGMGGRE